MNAVAMVERCGLHQQGEAAQAPAGRAIEAPDSPVISLREDVLYPGTPLPGQSDWGVE